MGVDSRLVEAKSLIHEAVVVEGRSYEDAVRVLRERAERAAAPYHEAADVLRKWLAAFEQGTTER